jgi:MoaA/NifB/PqqE/SkfB family radical SAM enzyme
MDRRLAAALVDAGLDFIGFSIAGTTAETHAAIRVHSELEQLLEAVEHVRAVQQERGSQRPRVHFAYLMLKANMHELPALPELAHRAGAEELVLTNLVEVADEWQDEQKAFGPGGEERYGELLRETERRARARNLRIRAAALSPAPAPVCEEDPRRNLFVTVEGDVTACVYLCPPVRDEFTRRTCGREHRVRRLSFGNLFREPLDEIWNGPAYVEFRDGFRRRERGAELLTILRSAPQQVAPSQLQLPDPPPPCRSCHKMLGV